MRICRFIPIAVAALLAGGCFHSTTLIRINADGSGTIEQTTLVTEAALQQLRQLAAAAGENGKTEDIFSEDQARQMATALGPDVTVVSSTKIKNADGEGSRAVLAFSDINRLQVKKDPAAADSAGIDSGVSVASNVHFFFSRTSDGRSLLRITSPAGQMLRLPQPTAPAGSGGAPQTRIAPEQLAMMRQLFAGMRVYVGIEPAGQLVKTNSPFVDGQRVTLVEVSLDQLLANETVFSRLQGARSVEDAKAAMKDLPGLKIDLDPEITIEFVGK
jgi:hypothetical protein